MAKKLLKVGNSLAVVIDKPLLESLEWDASTMVELGIAGSHLKIVHAGSKAPSRATAKKKTKVKTKAKKR
jgi:antitoxin component of MazEF toxin-antitoxin module